MLILLDLNGFFVLFALVLAFSWSRECSWNGQTSLGEVKGAVLGGGGGIVIPEYKRVDPVISSFFSCNVNATSL